MLAITMLVTAPVAGWNTQRQAAPEAHSTAVQLDGKQAFATSCASCHGLDGRGGARAPNLITSVKTQQNSDAELELIIQNGIPSGGMPAYRGLLGGATIRAIVKYLRVAQGRQRRPISGDPQKGRQLFFGKGGCAECHTVKGEGGFIAPDLSEYAEFAAADEVRSAVVDPGKHRDPLKIASVSTQDNQGFSGVVRNEDNFSLQLQTRDGAFHLFMKSDIKHLEYHAESLMPSNYGSVLNEGEIADLVSFLVQAAHASPRSKSETIPSIRQRSR